jgi:hypothetical protein
MSLFIIVPRKIHAQIQIVTVLLRGSQKARHSCVAFPASAANSALSPGEFSLSSPTGLVELTETGKLSPVLVKDL